MKKTKYVILFALLFIFTACDRVAPNYQGVLMQNFGQNGKSDFTLVKGRVWTTMPGVELFQVPLFEQRGEFNKPLKLKASNNTEFQASPKYSYRVIENRAIDVVFDAQRFDSEGANMLKSIEDNMLEPRIEDLIKEYSRTYHTDTLMANGGQLIFERNLQEKLKELFAEKGFELLTFQSQLEFTEKVKNKIDNRNEVNANISVLNSQIEEQIKINELEQLKTDQLIIKSRGLTPEILQQQFIEKWDGHTPLYGDSPFFIKDTK